MPYSDRLLTLPNTILPSTSFFWYALDLYIWHIPFTLWWKVWPCLPLCFDSVSLSPISTTLLHDRLRKFLRHPLLTMLDPWNLFQIKPSVHTYFWKEKREGLIQFNSTCHIPHCLFIHKTIPIHLLKHSQTTSASFFLSGPRNNHTLFKVSRVPRIDSLLFL